MSLFLLFMISIYQYKATISVDADLKDQFFDFYLVYIVSEIFKIQNFFFFS